MDPTRSLTAFRVLVANTVKHPASPLRPLSVRLVMHAPMGLPLLMTHSSVLSVIDAQWVNPFPFHVCLVAINQ